MNSLIIEDLNKEEFEALVINIFYYLDYNIDKAEYSTFDYYLEKEELKILLKINFKENNSLNYLEEIIELKNEVINTNSWKGYFFTNSDFDATIYDKIEGLEKYLRLFNRSESLRLGLRSI